MLRAESIHDVFNFALEISGSQLNRIVTGWPSHKGFTLSPAVGHMRWYGRLHRAGAYERLDIPCLRRYDNNNVMSHHKKTLEPGNEAKAAGCHGVSLLAVIPGKSGPGAADILCGAYHLTINRLASRWSYQDSFYIGERSSTCRRPGNDHGIRGMKPDAEHWGMALIKWLVLLRPDCGDPNIGNISQTYLNEERTISSLTECGLC